MACRGFLQCLLKLFNLALALVGVLLLVFSVSLLVKEQPPHPPAPSPSPPLPSLLATQASRLSSLHPLLSSSKLHASAGEPNGKESRGERDIAPRFSSRALLLDPAHWSRVTEDGASQARAGSAASQARATLTAPKLPNLWFTYLLIGVGAYVTLLTLMGAIAAESNIVCCMTSYQFGLCFLLLVQLVAAALVWLDEVPPDPTGEYDRRRKFVEDNLELCKLAALCLLIVEGTALLLAMMLRAIQVDEATVDDDEDYLMPRTHLLHQQQHQQQQQAQRRLSYGQPMLGAGQGGGQQPSQLMGTASGANMGSTTGLLPTASGTPHTDTWRGRLMEKYGMDPNEFQYGAADPRGGGGGGGGGVLGPVRSSTAVASSSGLPSAAWGSGQEPQGQGSGQKCSLM